MEGRASNQVTATAPQSGLEAPVMSVSADGFHVCTHVYMMSHVNVLSWLLLVIEYVCCLSRAAVCTPPCLNGGVCAASSSCLCPAGWTGSSCETAGRSSLCHSTHTHAHTVCCIDHHWSHNVSFITCSPLLSSRIIRSCSLPAHSSHCPGSSPPSPGCGPRYWCGLPGCQVQEEEGGVPSGGGFPPEDQCPSRGGTDHQEEAECDQWQHSLHRDRLRERFSGEPP